MSGKTIKNINKNKNISRKRRGGGKETPKKRSRSRSRSRSPPARPKKDGRVTAAEAYIQTRYPDKLDVIIIMFDEDHSLFEDIISIIKTNEYYKAKKSTLVAQIKHLQRLFNNGIFDNETEIKTILKELLETGIFYFLYLSEQEKLNHHQDALHSKQFGTLDPMPLVDIEKNIVYLKYITDQ